MTRKWPFPADTPTDRARRIAQAYRAALQAVAPDQCAQLDDQAQQFGETWVVPVRQTYDPTDVLTAEQVAAALGEKPATVRQWASRGIIPREVGGFVLDDVLAALAQRRKLRAKHRVP